MGEMQFRCCLSPFFFLSYRRVREIGTLNKGTNMKKVYVVLVGGGIEAVFEHNLDLIKEYFLMYHDAKDMNFDELLSHRETEYQFYIDRGVEKVEIYEQYVFKKITQKNLDRAITY